VIAQLPRWGDWVRLPGVPTHTLTVVDMDPRAPGVVRCAWRTLETGMLLEADFQASALEVVRRAYS
jgi:hypothetical protein